MLIFYALVISLALFALNVAILVVSNNKANATRGQARSRWHDIADEAMRRALLFACSTFILAALGVAWIVWRLS